MHKLMCVVVRTFEYGGGPELHVHVGDLAGQLHGRRHHVHALARVVDGQEDVPQQHQRARRQPVQVLGVRHLQRLPQVPSVGDTLCYKGDLDWIMDNMHS